MLKGIAAIAFLLLAMSTAARAQETGLASSVFKIASQSVVTVIAMDKGKRSQGSGVVSFSRKELNIGTNQIPPLTHVVTNAHVVGSAKSVQIRIGNQEYEGEVLGLDDDLDLALIVVKEVFLSMAKILPPNTILEIGAPVFAIGSPLGLERTITSGLVSSVRKKGEITLLQISAPISPGSSGGGLFNDRGELLGITTSKLMAGEGIGFAVAATHIAELREASYASGRLRLFATSHLGQYLGVSEKDGNRLGGNDLTKWLRSTRDNSGRALYYFVQEKIKALDEETFEEKKESKPGSAGHSLMRVVKQYLQTAPVAAKEVVTNDLLRLLCEWEGPRGQKEQILLIVDFTSRTVNGNPAKISDESISWEISQRSSAVVDRYGGSFGLKLGDFVTVGKCVPQTEKRF